MMRRLSTRAWVVLMIALGFAATASGAGLVLSLHAGSRAQPAAAAASPGPQPGSTQARADLTRMQTLLNSGSASEQAALLVPPFRFMPGSYPVYMPGTTVTVKPGTFRQDGRFGTVTADVSDGTTSTLGLYLAQGHWRLYRVAAGTVQTRASITGPVRAQLMSDSPPATVKACPSPKEIGTRVPVILVHGAAGSPESWGLPGDSASMFHQVDQIQGVWTSAFDYTTTSTRWVDDQANGPALAKYIRCVAQASASKDAGGNGKVIIVAYSMGGLLTRYAATTGGEAGDIAKVITIGTPNTGDFLADAGKVFHDLLCANARLALRSNPAPDSFCTQWTALAGMARFGPEIKALKELPSTITLDAIAGELSVPMTLGSALVSVPLGGDGLVLTSSALHQRPGGGPGSATAIRARGGQPPWSVWHGVLTGNPDIIARVHDLIYAYVQAHPPPAPAQAPASGPCYNPQCEVPLSPSPSATPLYHQPVANNTVKPGTVGFSGDATNIFTATNGWSNWGSASTTATGLITYEGCVPDCARGTQTPTPATVTFSGLVSGEYTTVTEVILSGPAAGTAYSNAPLTGTWPWVNA